MTDVKPLIAVDGRALLEPRNAGVYRYASRLLRAMRDENSVELHVWANAAAGPTPPDVDRRTRIPNKLLHAALLCSGRPRLDRLASPGRMPDVFWSPNLHFVSVSPGIRFALTVHDLAFLRYPEFLSPRRRLWHLAVRPAALVRRAETLLAVSEQTKRDLIELYGVAPERVRVAYPGCDETFFSSPGHDALLRTRLRYRLPERFILHAGALEPRKNHLSLLAAFERLRENPAFSELGLVLVGPDGWRNGEIMRAISRSPARAGIIRLGFVPEGDLPALYRLASVFAFPSFYEGFGLPPLEAMASGTPVVASFAGSLGEVLHDAAILTDPYRPGELADALAAVLDSPSLTERFALLGTQRARAFGWNACAHKTIEALGTKPGG